jgi:hypothetical protein
MIKQITYAFFAVCISLLLFQCKAKKPLIKQLDVEQTNSKLQADTLVSNLLKNNFEFVDLKAKIRTKFKSREKQNLQFGTFIKMKKDSAIHATISILNIPVVVALITPDSLKFINKKDQQYFVGDFNYVKEILKTDISFQEIQNLLIGNPIRLDSLKNNYLINDEQEVYISSMSQNQLNARKKSTKLSSDWLVKYWINELYKPGKTLLLNDSAQTSITVTQADYNKVNGQEFPNRTEAQIITPNDSIVIQLNYQRVKINSDVDFEFSIPSHYTPFK